MEIMPHFAALLLALLALTVPARAEDLSRFLGRPVYGAAGGGRLGQVSDVLVGADGQPAMVVVGLDEAVSPSRASLPVPWQWVQTQQDAPTFVVPWSQGQVQWLAQGPKY